MFRLKVDISEVVALTREGISTLGSSPARMLELLREKAAEERATHLYQNRTGNLEASTFGAWVEQGPNEYSVEFGARTFYASYVDNRGLTRVHELAGEAEIELDFMLDADAERLSRL